MADSSPRSDASSAPRASEAPLDGVFRDLAPARPLEASDVTVDEGRWATEDQQGLAWRAWEGDSSARATVVLMHGYAEHSGRYGHVAAALARSGCRVIALDARGHGRSDGPRGHIDRFELYVDDVELLVRRARERWPGLPVFVLGHSNGGLIALRYALRRPRDIAGFIVTSPLCKFGFDVPAAKELMGRMASRLWPTLAIPSGLNAALLSHLEEVVEGYRHDPLVFTTATARWFTEAQYAMADLAGRAHTLDQPFLFLVAGADRIVDPRATRRLFEGLASSDRELEVYDALYHEILNERPWPDIVRRAVAWIDRRLAS